MAGDPDLATAQKILDGLPGAGADLIELGFPFSDPMAEGPPIQRSAQRALAAGTTMDDVLGLVRAFRAGDQATPIILMGYMNLVLHRGIEAFARDAAAAGVDGLIIVDCPPEEAEPLADALDAADVSLIRLATPTTDDARMKVVVRRTSGFVYYVSVAGVTGVKAADASAVAPHVERVRKASGLPVAVGFGIRTPEQAAAIARVADAAVVGSALVDEVAEAVEMNEDVTARVLSKVELLAKAVRLARVGQTTTV
jgi:tryptophan synthase alpha chain